MFRVLSDEEAKRVTRWQAPEIKGTVPVARTKQVARPVKLGASSAVATTSATGAGQTLAQSVDPGTGRQREQSADSVAVAKTTQVPLNSPSADMLQSSYDEGYTRGLSDGAAQAQQSSVQQIQALITALGRPALKVPDAEIEQELLCLAMEIATLVIGRELQQDARAMAEIVRRGIEHLPNASAATVRVYLHPEDEAMLEEFAEWPENVKITGDTALKRGDCRVVSGASTVHAGKDDWLAIVRAEFGLLPGTTSTAEQSD